jgi:hypothetical protein
MRRICCGLVLAALGVASPNSATADEIRIDNPVVDGVPIDWCQSWGQRCGWLGAHAFCRDRGYQHAVRYETFTPGRTYIAGDDTFCSGPTCTAFLSVTCLIGTPQRDAAPPTSAPRRVRFDYPRNDGAPADWCSLRGEDCGWGGANKFCEYRGFDRAIDFSTYRPGFTAVLDDPTRCQGPHCTGLRHVVCERSAQVEPPPGPYSSAPQPPRYPPPGQRDGDE